MASDRPRSRGGRTLQQLGDSLELAEGRMLARLERAWPLVVGPALARHTRPLRLRSRTLVMGCWRNEVMAGLRASAAAAWPELQGRLKRMLGLGIVHLDIVPCDPPPAPAPPAPRPEDPLRAVLQRYRELARRGWTKRRS